MTDLRILVAMDAFKGSLSAQEACDFVKRGLHKALPKAWIKKLPMADGGEGSLELLLKYLPGGIPVSRHVMGPLPSMQVSATFGFWPDQKLAVIEAAKACGLPLVSPSQRDPMIATTFGVGQLMGAAMEMGVIHIILAVGGSATMDAGVGAARAMGWQATDALGLPLEHGPKGLENLVSLQPPDSKPPVSIDVWCDVDIPLLGPRGSAMLFGPQKGATVDQVSRVEQAFAKLAAHPTLESMRLAKDISGSGAAGGLAWGTAVFAGAKLQPGSQQFSEKVELDRQLDAVDIVVTGEGCFDKTSLSGKVVSQVARLARRNRKHLAILAGQIHLPIGEVGAIQGIAAKPETTSLEDALENAGTYLENAAFRLGQSLAGNSR